MIQYVAIPTHIMPDFKNFLIDLHVNTFRRMINVLVT